VGIKEDLDSGSKRFKILCREQPHNIVTEGIRKMFMFVSWASLGIAFICAIVIVIDEIRHPQTMWIMSRRGRQDRRNRTSGREAILLGDKRQSLTPLRRGLRDWRRHRRVQLVCSRMDAVRQFVICGVCRRLTARLAVWKSGLLVHDANWDDSWILHVLPNESLAHSVRLERRDGMTPGRTSRLWHGVGGAGRRFLPPPRLTRMHRCGAVSAEFGGFSGR
jgi:hypothetical protein